MCLDFYAEKRNSGAQSAKDYWAAGQKVVEWPLTSLVVEKWAGSSERAGLTRPARSLLSWSIGPAHLPRRVALLYTGSRGAVLINYVNKGESFNKELHVLNVMISKSTYNTFQT